METRVKVYAKINLSLAVTGKKGEFHSLDTVMASIDLANEISLTKRNDYNLSVRFSNLDLGEKSNAYKSCKLLMEKSGCKGADVVISQAIPSGGGLGGSSADSAGVIRAMQKAYGISDEIANEVAVSIGSDVAYMLNGGVARLKGTHDELQFFDINVNDEILICGKGEVNTGECFKRFDDGGKSDENIDNDSLIACLKSGDIINASQYFINDLQRSACLICPFIQEILTVMSDCGLRAVMTGSGAYVFATGKKEALKKANDLLCEKGFVPLVVKLRNNGIEFL